MKPVQSHGFIGRVLVGLVDDVSVRSCIVATPTSDGVAGGAGLLVGGANRGRGPIGEDSESGAARRRPRGRVILEVGDVLVVRKIDEPKTGVVS